MMGPINYPVPYIENNIAVEEEGKLDIINSKMIKVDKHLSHINQLPIVGLDDRTFVYLAAVGKKGSASIGAKLLRTISRVCEFVAHFFFGFGTVMAVCSLLGILIDKPTTVKLISVLTGVAIGCGLYLLGSIFRLQARFWRSLERIHVHSYFNSLPRQVGQIARPENITQELDNLKQWGRLKNLTQTRDELRNISQGLFLDSFSQHSNEAIQGTCEYVRKIQKKISNFELVRKHLAEIPGGMEVLSYLRA